MNFPKLDSDDVVEVHSESRMAGIEASKSIPTPLHTLPDYRLDATDLIVDSSEQPATR
jgi:hypothetical protein